MPQDGTIAKMLKHSKYSWVGLSDNRTLQKEGSEDPVTWATMMTGVNPENIRLPMSRMWPTWNTIRVIRMRK